MPTPLSPKDNVPFENIKDLIAIRVKVDGATKITCTKHTDDDKWFVEAEIR